MLSCGTVFVVVLCMCVFCVLCVCMQSEYLHPHLHGIVAYFNIILVRRDYFENREKGKLAISSLTELIRLMGPKYITDVKLKIIAMLR